LHGIAVAVLVVPLLAALHTRHGRINAHRRTMPGLSIGALIITGAFNLMPGRLPHGILLGD